MTYVLDACALIALFNDEAGAGIVGKLLKQAEAGTARLFMSSVQVVEVYYDSIYVDGREYAEATLDYILNSQITILTEISPDIIREAGRFKTMYSMSLADSFAAAAAKSLNATLVTKDSEMEPAERAGEFSVLWLK